ncbi:MAG: FAD-binding oxidoreductase, partial [Myxococcales bacterium]|nr:FAD-binding oxidoreductase [Myxococcales bacterium]
RGAGQCSGLYGKIEDMTAAIELVDGRGEIVTLRRRLTGPDMTPLIVGSEGILGVITATQLRLHAAPARRGYAAFSFPTMEAGYDTIRRIYQAGLRPAVCRLYDPFDSMMAKRGQGKKRPAKAAEPRRRPLAWLEGLVAQSALRFPGPLNQAIDTLGSRAFGGAMLVLLTEGDAARVEDETPRIHKLCLDAGGEDLGEGPARHWLDRRYAVSYRQAPMFMMGTFVDTMEVAAPWARFGDLYEGVRRALGDHVMVMAHMSHAYPDGCSIYFTFAGSAGSDEEAERIYDEAWRAAAEAAIAAGGTLSHHHGVGRSKAPFLSDELGLGIEVVRAIKGALDPDGILNPSNLLPADDPARRALPPPLGAPRLDEQSETVEASGKHRLEEVEAVAAGLGLSLGLPREALGATVGEWLGAGAPGAPDPWLDPTDHLVAGYRARLPKGAGLEIRPCPRRAVGPDLWALFAGTGGRAGTIESAHLRVRGPAPRGLETPLEREPAPSGAETAFIDRVLGAVAAIE